MPPAHRDTPLGARPTPNERDIVRVFNVFDSGDASTPHEKLLVKVDSVVQSEFGRLRDDKILILAKIAAEMKSKLASPGDDESRFVEKALRFLKTPESKIWLRSLFFHEQVTETAPSAPAGTASRPNPNTSSSCAHEMREHTTALSYNPDMLHFQPEQRQASRVGQSPLLPPLLEHNDPLIQHLDPFRRPAPLRHSHGLRSRRLSDSAATLSPRCAYCGQHWLAHIPGGAQALVLAQLGSAIAPPGLAGQVIRPQRNPLDPARVDRNVQVPDVVVKVDVAQDNGPVEVRVIQEVNVRHHQPLGSWDYLCRAITVMFLLGWLLVWSLAISVELKKSA